MTVTDSPTSAIRVQALVIGSGAGGTITALELARAGYEVVVLEEGERHSLEDYGKPLPQAMQMLYRNKGMTPILGSVPIGFVEGRCLGGSTEVNSGFWHRLPPEFVLRWKKRFGIKDLDVDSLASHFDWLEEKVRLSVATTLPRSTSIFKEGVEKMGWSAQVIPRAASACVNTNSCPSGCPKGAKQGMTQNLIPEAEAAGVRFFTGAQVRLLLKSGNSIEGVLANVRREDGSTDLVRIDADHVFVCAGATQTPVLLRRSGIKFHVGDTFQIHPMLKVCALFDEQIDAHKTVMPMVQVKEFWPDISMGGSFFTVGQLAMNLSDNWPDTRGVMPDYRNMATYYVAVRGIGRGTVRPARSGSEYAILKYDLGDADIRHLSQGLARLSTLLLSAGAKAVYPSVQAVPVIDSEFEAVRWLDEDLPRKALSLTTIHAFSTCPMGESMDRCAVDSYGKVFGFNNLFINDASMLPDSPGINPQGTVMAIARRNILHFLEKRPKFGANRDSQSLSYQDKGIAVHHGETMTDKLAIVTGAPGWLGSRLVESLKRGLPDVADLSQVEPRAVRVLKLPGIDDSGLRALGEGIGFVDCNLTNSSDVKNALGDAAGATVFHCAGIIHPDRGRKQFYDVNVEGTRNVLNAAIASGAKRFIHVSSNSPIGTNDSPNPEDFFDENSPYNPYMHYGLSKKQGEDLVNEAHKSGKIETVIIRPPWFYGPGQPPRQSLFFTMIKNGKAPIVGSGNNMRSMAYVDNICQGLMLCERVPHAAGNTYWIADRRPYTMNEIVDTIERLLETEFSMQVAHKRMRLPGIASEVALMVDLTLQSLGLYHQKFHVLSEMNKNIACTIGKAEKELGYDPKIALEEGMRRSLRWVLDQGWKI